MMCFTDGVNVERLEVDCASWLAIFLRTYDHSMTPCHWFSNRNWLNNTETHIPIKTIFDSFLPMKRNWDWSVMGNWFCCKIDVQM